MIKHTRNLICLIVILSSIHSVVAQNRMDSLMFVMNKSRYKCEDVTVQSMQAIMNYYQSGQKDSVSAVLEFWERKCGNIEAVQRTKILYAIDNNRYHDAVVDDGILELVFEYKYLEPDTFPEENLKEQYNRFTRQLAEKNRLRFSEERIEYVWCDFYSSGSNNIFYYIQQYRYPDSKLTEEYFRSVEKERSKRYLHFALTAGTWIPTGGLTVFGVHPEVGFMVGFKYKRWSCDMNVNFRFLKTPDSYSVIRYDFTEQSRRFNAVHVGFDVGYDLLYLPKHKVAILGGVGYEGFNALKRDNAAQLGPVNINTYNINFGGAYTYHINASYYVGFTAKCHFVDYTMNEAMSYSGVPFTLKLKTGWLIHDWHKSDRLHELRYKNL